MLPVGVKAISVTVKSRTSYRGTGPRRLKTPLVMLTLDDGRVITRNGRFVGSTVVYRYMAKDYTLEGW